MKRTIKFLLVFNFLMIIFLFVRNNFFGEKYTENIQVEVYSSSIIIPVSIEGEKYNFQLDTGAPTCVSNGLLEKLNLPVSDIVPAEDYYGNKSQVKVSMLPEIQIGRTKFTDIDVGIIDPIQNFLVCDVKVDGYLGSDFFSGKILQIDIKNKLVKISNQHSDFNLNEKDAVKIKLMGKQKTPELPIYFPSKKASEYVSFDTGSSNHLYRIKMSTFKKMLKDSVFSENEILFQKTGSSGAGVFGPQKDSINYVVNLDSIKIGNSYFLNWNGETFGSGEIGKSKLGAHLLDKGIVSVDFINKNFYFKPYKEGPVKRNAIGVRLGFKDNRFYVGVVIPGSIADKNGVKKGYVLDQYNLVKMDSLTTCDILNVFKTKPIGGENIYVFKGEGKEVEVIVNG